MKGMFTGFDPQKIKTTLNTIESAYGEIHNATKVYIQDGFILGMKDKWACNEAQVFFAQVVKPQFDEIIAKVNKNFTVITEGINAAAQIWAAETRSEYSKTNLTVINTTIDVSMIQENINGTRGIDKNAALGLTNKIKLFQNAAEEALSKAQNAISGSGLFGGAQEQNLYNALGMNKSVINDYIVAMNNSLNKAISDTVSSYGDAEGRISQAFNVQ